MDDQQGTLITDLAWVGGIIDGEGCLAIYYRSDTGGYGARISIRNTSHSMIERVKCTLDKAGVPSHIREIGIPPSGIKRLVKSRKAMWDLHIDGIKRVRRALEVLIPYIHAKSDQAKLLNDFVTHRIEQGHFAGYGVFDEWCCKRIKEIRDSSETMSMAEIYSDDIVRTATKVAEAAEMTAR